MLPSEKTTDLIFNLKEYSSNCINNIDDISLIIDLTYSNNNENDFMEITFQSKYLKGVRNVLSKDIEDESAKLKLSDELKSNLEDLSKKLIIIVEQSDQSSADMFKNKYFKLTQECFSNYMSLIDDLTICKEYFNYIKYDTE
jgi:hypothetical protein